MEPVRAPNAVSSGIRWSADLATRPMEITSPTSADLKWCWQRAKYWKRGPLAFPAAPAAPVYRWGLGPSLDGLFTQSNLGVVTRMTFWLMPAPEYFQAFFFRCDRDEALPPLDRRSSRIAFEWNAA